MRKYSLAFALTVATSLLAPAAIAAAPTGQGSPGELELRDGSAGALGQHFAAAPRARSGQRLLRTLAADLGGRVRGTWSTSTGLPTSLWGFSVDASSDPDAPARISRETLARHLAFLAPRAIADDFVPGTDVVSRGAGGLRTIGFAQHWRGMPVLGAHVLFSFKNGRMFAITSSALPAVSPAMPDALVSSDVARDAAMAWVREGASGVTAGDVDGPFVLPYRDHGLLTYAVVLRVSVEARRPVGSYAVYVDAATGEPIARTQRLMFETARLELEAWERSPSYGERVAYPGDGLTLDFEGSDIEGTSEADGSFAFNGDSVAGTFLLDGDHVQVENAAGSEVELDFQAVPDETVLWSESDELRDAQVASYVHASRVKSYARTFAPDLDFLDDPVKVTVNEDDVCNAYSDGTRVHFFASGGGCENTGLIADVVYHEYGHSIHCHTYQKQIPQEPCIPDGALSEGHSDYLAVTMTGDHGMGRGFFYDESPLRDLDPDGEHVWPDDVVGEPHYDGEIIGGTLWDLRKSLIEDLGEEEGIATSDRLVHEALAHAANIPQMYPQMLIVDDDDGDLDNGTPHQCRINAAFQRHGLRPIEKTIDVPAIAPPSVEGAEISVRVEGLTAACGEAFTSGFISYQDTTNPTEGGTVEMTVDGDGVAHGRVPTKNEGHVVTFVVSLEGSLGSLHFPDNPADPAYQIYVGETVPIYCTGFETDPFAEGWSHELVSGVDELGADDWMWGEPGGDGLNGDPEGAFGGDLVVGNDLSPTGETKWDGHYKADRHTALVSPVIPAGGFQQVRLQYRRWLNVEDGHFDHASILANGVPAWQNADSGLPDDQASIHHADREWRFHDVELTPYLDAAQNVQLRFELESDAGVELGGWTIDDLCVVGVVPRSCPPGEACGGTGDPPQPVDPSTDPEMDPSLEDDADGDDLAASGGCDCEVRGERGASSPAALVGLTLAAAAVARRRRR